MFFALLRRGVLSRIVVLMASVGAAYAFCPHHLQSRVATASVPNGRSAAAARRRSELVMTGHHKMHKKHSGRGRRPAPHRYTDGHDLESFQELAGQISADVYRSSTNYFKNLESCPALVLNADYQPLSYLPLSLWTWQDAVKAVFMDRVVVLDTYSDRAVRSCNFEMQLPSVIALKDYVQQHAVAPTFTRRNLYLRDGYRCQYCARFFHGQHLSYDHVMPKRLGGTTAWDNVVTCCQGCNNRKSDCHPSNLPNIGMRLLRKPTVPTYHELQVRARRYPPRLIHETWHAYLLFERGLPTDTDKHAATAAATAAAASSAAAVEDQGNAVAAAAAAAAAPA